MIKSIFLLTFSFLLQCSFAQLDANALIEKSIAYHDPKDNWSNINATLEFTTTMADSSKRQRTVVINNKENTFSFIGVYDEGKLEYSVKNDEGTALWNGTADVPGEVAKKYRISKDRAVMYRNYYSYLYGMPMKLKDPGTHVESKVELVEFYGKEYNKVRVTYDPEVGTDTWYFYFNPKTHALEAYQFFKDESKNDGEYILFDGLVEKDKVRMPRIVHWYYNTDQKFLATDILK